MNAAETNRARFVDALETANIASREAWTTSDPETYNACSADAARALRDAAALRAAPGITPDLLDRLRAEMTSARRTFAHFIRL
jgi:hypothetical protein